MPRPNASALWLCLAIAAMLTLSSCGRQVKASTGLTPRSEAVCDSAPPEAIPPQPSTNPERDSWVRGLVGLYEQQVDRWLWEARCRAQVRAENAAAFERVGR